MNKRKDPEKLDSSIIGVEDVKDMSIIDNKKHIPSITKKSDIKDTINFK